MIRRAVETDIEDILQLYLEMIERTYGKEKLERAEKAQIREYLRVLMNSSKFCVLVSIRTPKAKEDGVVYNIESIRNGDFFYETVSGFACGMVERVCRGFGNEITGHINEIYVSPEANDGNHEERLLESMEEWMKKWGASRVKFEIPVDRKKCHGFFMDRGYYDSSIFIEKTLQ